MHIYIFQPLLDSTLEAAITDWQEGKGSLKDCMIRAHHSIWGWKEGFEQLGCQVTVDLRPGLLWDGEVIAHWPPGVRARIGAVRRKTPLRHLDALLLNVSLLRRLRQARADVLLESVGRTLRPETLRVVRAMGIRAVEWFGVRPDTMPAGSVQLKKLPLFDAVFSCIDFSPAQIKYGIRHFDYIPSAINPKVHHPLVLSAEDRARYGAEVSFVGSLARAHQHRNRYLEYAIQRGLPLKVWGYAADELAKDSPILQCYQGPCWGETLTKVYNAAKVHINIQWPLTGNGECVRTINMRTFELAACGAFQLTSYVPGLEDVFTLGQDLVCFSSPEEMVEKAEYYLSHDEERQQVAQRGLEIAQQHTYLQSCQEMVNALRYT